MGKGIGRSSGLKSPASRDPDRIRFVLAGIGGDRGAGCRWFGWLVGLYTFRRDLRILLFIFHEIQRKQEIIIIVLLSNIG